MNTIDELNCFLCLWLTEVILRLFSYLCAVSIIMFNQEIRVLEFAIKSDLPVRSILHVRRSLAYIVTHTMTKYCISILLSNSMKPPPIEHVSIYPNITKT